LYSITDYSRIGSGGLLDPSCVTTRFADDGTTPIGPDYTRCPGLNPNVLALNVRENRGHSSYQALNLRIDSRRLARWGAEFGVNYPWSHSIDNRSFSGASLTVAYTGGDSLEAFHHATGPGQSDVAAAHSLSEPS